MRGRGGVAVLAVSDVLWCRVCVQLLYCGFRRSDDDECKRQSAQVTSGTRPAGKALPMKNRAERGTRNGPKEIDFSTIRNRCQLDRVEVEENGDGERTKRREEEAVPIISIAKVIPDAAAGQ